MIAPRNEDYTTGPEISEFDRGYAHGQEWIRLSLLDGVTKEDMVTVCDAMEEDFRLTQEENPTPWEFRRGYLKGQRDGLL